MNAVIVDIRKKQAAALDESGRVVRIHNAGYEIGQTIELHEVKPVRTPTMFKRLSTGVAAAVLVAMIGTGTAYAMPYGTVTLDGDSSIEYTINCFDYVLDVQATNEEGEAVLAEMDTGQLRHHRIDAAVATTVKQIEQREPFEGEPQELHLQLETPSDGHTERLRQELAPFIEMDNSHDPILQKNEGFGEEHPWFPEQTEVTNAPVEQSPLLPEGLPQESEVSMQELQPEQARPDGENQSPQDREPHDAADQQQRAFISVSGEGILKSPDEEPELSGEGMEEFQQVGAAYDPGGKP